MHAAPSQPTPLALSTATLQSLKQLPHTCRELLGVVQPSFAVSVWQKPGLHAKTQAPAAQEGESLVVLQLVSQVPQLVVVLSTSVHVPPQHSCDPLPLQTLPQVLQFRTSVDVSMQNPPQQLWPFGHDVEAASPPTSQAIVQLPEGVHCSPFVQSALVRQSRHA